MARDGQSDGSLPRDRRRSRCRTTCGGANYSLQAFEAKRLDYGLHFKPIEDWGHPEYVLKAVAAENEVVRRLVK